MTKQELQEQINKLQKQLENLEPEYAEEPSWGYKAGLTEEFLAQTMVLDGVMYHRHKHGGGWVSDKARVDETVWVGPLAIVHNGVIIEQAVIHDHAEINCDGQQECGYNIGGSAQVHDSARVFGSSRVYDSAEVYGSARVYDSAQVFNSAQVFDLTLVFNSAQVFNSVRVFNSSWVYGSAQVYGNGYLKRSTSEDIELKNGETIE